MDNRIKSVFKNFVLFLLVFEMMLPQTLVFSQQQSADVAGQGIAQFTQNLLDQDLSQEQRNLLMLSQMAQSGKTEQLETSIFGLMNQKVILDPQQKPQVFDLNKGEAPLVKPAYTRLNFKADNERKLLVIEGISGADQHGRNGKVIAQHVFEGLDVASISSDNLMVTIIEKSGRVSAISKHMLIQLGFQAPVAIFRNLNGGSSLISLDPDLKTESEFVTRAAQPLSQGELAKTKNVTENDARTFQTGELLIWQRNHENERVNITRMPTLPILSLLSVGLKYMYAASQLVSYNPEAAKELEQIVKEMYELKAQGGLDELASRLSPLEVSMLSRYSSDQVMSALASSQHLSAKDAAEKRHLMSLDEWQKLNDELVKNAVAQKAAREAQIAKRQQQSQRLAVRIKNYFKRFDVLDPQDYQVNSRNMDKLTSKQSVPDLTYVSASQSIQRKVLQILSAPKTTFSLIGVALTGTYAGSYAYEASQNLRDARVVSYFYENVLPEVVKDHAYRGPLILSTVIQLAIIPLVYVSAWALKSGVTTLAFVYKDSTSKFGLYVKDFVAKYKDLTTSQVLLTMNVRFFSLIVVPYWRVLIAGVMGQKSFFPAVENGLNPFTKVKADSPIGRAAGLTQDTFIGIGKPSYRTKSDSKKSDESAKQQQTLIKLLKEQKNKIETLSWYLATAAISEKYQLSPGDLFVAAQRSRISVATYAALFKDPSLRAEAEMINEQVRKLLMTSSEFDLEKLQSQLTAEDFSKLTQLAREVAEKISEQSELKSLTQQHFLKFKGSLHDLSNWVVNLGQRQRAFLSQVFPSLYTAKQVNQDFPVDQAMVSVLSGIAGDQANLSKPNYLMADPTRMMQTSDTQINSVFSNVYGHLVGSAAAQTMLYDDIRVETEKSYQSPESGRIQVAPQQQSLVGSAVDWFQFAVLSPTKADIGGLAVQQYVNRVNTIFASITFSVLTKILLTSQTPHEAILSFAAGFLLGHYAFAWPWGFIQAGNRFIGKKAESNKELVVSRLAEIQRVLSSESAKEGELKTATSDLVKLYMENNPDQVRQIIVSLKQVGDPYLVSKISSHFQNQKITETHFKKVGLIAKLIDAQKSGDMTTYQRVREALVVSIYDETHLEKSEIEKLNSEGLIKFAQAISPVHTAENAAITWITSIGFGAILTTVLYSNLAPVLMDPKLVNAPGFVLDALKTCLEFTAAFYLAFGKRPWLFYQSTFDRANEAYFKYLNGIPVFEKGILQTLRDTVGEKFSSVTSSAIKKNERNFKANTSIPMSIVRCESLF